MDAVGPAGAQEVQFTIPGIEADRLASQEYLVITAGLPEPLLGAVGTIQLPDRFGRDGHHPVGLRVYLVFKVLGSVV